MYHLSNHRLRITISAQGAELQSIYHTDNQLEYIWSGDPVFWGKKSPVLFPVVGGLKNNVYRFEGKEYKLGRHGFARDRQFVLTSQSDNSLCFTLEADKQSLETYPFLFRFSVMYTLEQENLTVTYITENRGKEPMYFSVGAHPAFAVPLAAGTVFTDYYVSFDKKETAGIWPLSAEGLIKTAPLPFLKNTDRLPLTKELFYADALVFKQLSSRSISIRSDKTPHGLTVAFTGFPYMGIWSARDAGFVCIEPWCGIADSIDASGDITQKEGIHTLLPAEKSEKSWGIKVF